MNIKLLDNGTKVRIKLAEEYRKLLIQVLQHLANYEMEDEYQIALAYETMCALTKSPAKLRLSEFLLCFDAYSMGFLDEPTQLLIRSHLDLDKFLQSRIPQALTQNLLQHG